MTQHNITNLMHRLALIADLPTKDITRGRYDYDTETIIIHYGNQKRQKHVSSSTVQLFDSLILSTIGGTQ